ncbi:hypothetical protein KOW79_013146 [Hemibagrus wyckioides]|uniref:Uncharacterized protein n=1 Tax=Hemibagrus wyckioides TaxID=337641 RepID=A0A9D3NKE5_9TELE|nr:hypothetical protein KOW79_013146 [Hemibagrus wyckioides]
MATNSLNYGGENNVDQTATYPEECFITLNGFFRLRDEKFGSFERLFITLDNTSALKGQAEIHQVPKYQA